MANSTNDVIAPPEGSITIEYMDETTNQRHVEKHTTARTVADFIRIENLNPNAVVTVEGVIASADGSTPINQDNEVTVVSGNKTGGGIAQKRKTERALMARGFSVQDLPSFDGTAKPRVVTSLDTKYNGKKQTFVILEGLEMPARMSGRISKYPFHLLAEPHVVDGQTITQCFHVPLRQIKTISAAMRAFMKKNTHVLLQGRTHILGRNTVYGIWRTQ